MESAAARGVGIGLALALAACSAPATEATDASASDAASARDDAAQDATGLDDASTDDGASGPDAAEDDADAASLDPGWTTLPGMSADCIRSASHPERVARLEWEACPPGYPTSCSRAAATSTLSSARVWVHALAYDRDHARGIVRLTTDDGLLDAIATTDGRVHVALARGRCVVDVGATDARVIVAITDPSPPTLTSPALAVLVGTPEDVLGHPLSTTGLERIPGLVIAVDATGDLAWISFASGEVYAWRSVDASAPPEPVAGRPLATAGGAMFYAPTISPGTYDDREVWTHVPTGADARVLAASSPLEGFLASERTLVHVAPGPSVAMPAFFSHVLGATPFATGAASATWTPVMDFEPALVRQGVVGDAVVATIGGDGLMPYRRQILSTFDLVTGERRHRDFDATAPSEEGIGWITADEIALPLTRVGGVTRLHRIGRDALAP